MAISTEPVKNLLEALQKDSGFERAILQSIVKFAEKDLKHVSHGDEPGWPGFETFLRVHLSGEGPLPWLEQNRTKLGAKAREALAIVDKIFEDNLYDAAFEKALDKGFLDLLKKVPGDKEARSIFSELAFDASNEDDEYGHRSASLRDAVVKLAHEQPELRKHLLPLLGKHAAPDLQLRVSTPRGQQEWLVKSVDEATERARGIQRNYPNSVVELSDGKAPQRWLGGRWVKIPALSW